MIPIQPLDLGHAETLFLYFNKLTYHLLCLVAKFSLREKMVQRLTYRRRHSYATKSNQHRVVKTPGNLSSLHFVRVSVYNNGECNFCFCLIGVVKFMQVVSLFIRQLRRELVDQNALLLEREFKGYEFFFLCFSDLEKLIN
jgi:hypothetical protein